MTNLERAASEDEQKVWRYMGFSRFIWLIQRKQLWLARADTLGDPWEIAVAGDQLAHMISRHPISALPLSGKRQETAMQRVARIIPAWRQKTCVSCWSAAHHESHALWRIYCGTSEGVAIQTTLGRLRSSAGGLPVHRISYETPGNKKQTPALIDLATKKRPMFEYEQEVRIIRICDNATDPTEIVFGHCLEWDPEKCVEVVRIRPDADHSFFETASAAVEHYAPALKDRVAWSAMKEKPPV